MLQQAGANKLQDPYGASTWTSAQARLKAMRTDAVKMNDRQGGFAQKIEFNNLSACEAGESIKPGASAPGQRDVTNQARETGESRGFSGFRPLRGLRTKPLFSWG